MGLIALCADDAGPWHAVEVGIRSSLWQRRVTLLCRDGTAVLEDAYADHIVLVENPPPDGEAAQPRTARRPIAVEMPLLAELAAFVRHLDGGPPPKSSAAEATEMVAAIAEIRRLAGI